MLNMYPRCVLEGYYAFIAHLRVHQQSVVGITLFVSTQGCGRPQTADEQEVDTHVFFVWLTKNNKKSQNLGVIRNIVAYAISRKRI